MQQQFTHSLAPSLSFFLLTAACMKAFFVLLFTSFCCYYKAFPFFPYLRMMPLGTRVVCMHVYIQANSNQLIQYCFFSFFFSPSSPIFFQFPFIAQDWLAIRFFLQWHYFHQYRFAGVILPELFRYVKKASQIKGKKNMFAFATEKIFRHWNGDHQWKRLYHFTQMYTTSSYAIYVYSAFDTLCVHIKQWRRSRRRRK